MSTKTERYDQLKQLHHDILNSLNTVHMGAQALEASPGDAELHQHVCESIQREQKVAAKLVGELFEAACEQHP